MTKARLTQRTHLHVVFSQTAASGWDQVCLAVKMHSVSTNWRLKGNMEPVSGF